MENDTFGGAILAWVKSAKVFQKVQAGTGDNLLEEDIREGFTDYCLWSTFRPESIDTDGELDMECLDSGMVLFRENCTPGEALESSYRQAFDTDFDKDDIAVLMEERRRLFTWWGKVGLKSQLFGSIMPARKRSVATLALHSCPLPAAPARWP